MTGSSIGGGSVCLTEIDGVTVQFSGERPILATKHTDEPGVIAGITAILYAYRINIGNMQVNRTDDGRTRHVCIWNWTGSFRAFEKCAGEGIWSETGTAAQSGGCGLTPGSGCEGTGQLRRKKGAVQVSREMGCREDSGQGRLCLYWIRKI